MSITPNMSLIVPEVLVTTGPTYATQVNTALDVIDAHDHSPGSGVRISPSGLNINADLPFNQFSATNLKSATLSAQLSASIGNGAVYRVADDLFYKRGDGTVVQITTAAGVNVSGVGGITGLVAPASATYTALSSTFGWFSDASTFSKLACGDLQVFSRAGSVGTVQAVTLKADVTTSAYDFNFPVAAPSANQLLRMVVGGPAVFVDLLGTNNQVTVTHNSGNTTLSLPQNIHTAATPTFAGLTLTGALGGTAATFSGALQAASATVTGNVSLTGALGSTLTAPNYTVSLNALTVNTVGPTVGSEVFVQSDLTVQNILKTNTIAVRTGSLVTFNNGISMPFLPITAGAIGGTNITASSGLIGATLNIGSSATVINSLGATINAITCAAISSPTGVEIGGRTSATPYPAFTIGEIVTQAMASNVTTSTAYQNLTSVNLTPGIWEVSANVQLTFNVNQNTARVRKLEAAVSLTSANADDAIYRSTQYLPLYGWGENGGNTVDRGQAIDPGESVSTVIFSRRIQITTTTTVYLVGKTQVYSGGTNNAYFNSGITLLKAQRVG
jgi:hypothetical protein